MNTVDFRHSSATSISQKDSRSSSFCIYTRALEPSLPLPPQFVFQSIIVPPKKLQWKIMSLKQSGIAGTVVIVENPASPGIPTLRILTHKCSLALYVAEYMT